MKFKELTQIPIALPDDTLPPTEGYTEHWGGNDHKSTRNVYTYQADVIKETLIVTIFRAGLFRYRIFLKEFDFCNQIVDRTKPSSATFGYLKQYQDKYVAVGDADEVIAKFLKDKFYNKNYRVGIDLLGAYQQELRADALKRKYDRIKESIDIEMLAIRPLPKDIYKWANQKVFGDKEYIFYHPTEHIGECSHCGKKFKISAQCFKHRGKHACPHCKSLATLISLNRWKNMNELKEYALCTYVQPTRKGWCVRKFSVNKYFANRTQYTDGWRMTDIIQDIPQGEGFRSVLSIEEYKRNFYEDGVPAKSFSYEEFYQTGEIRWCRGSLGGDYRNAGFTYPVSINKICRKDPQLKYMPVAEIIKLSGKLDIVDVLSRCKKYPCIEYLYKVGFINLALEICEYGSYYSDYGTRDKFGLVLDGKNIIEVLGVNKQDIKLLRGLNPKAVDLEMFKILEEKNCFDLEAFKWLQQTFKGERNDNLVMMLNYTTLVKAKNYVLKQVNSEQQFNAGDYYEDDDGEYYVVEGTDSDQKIREILSDWRDYISDCAKLKYDLKDTAVIFPKNLLAAHDRTIQITKIMANQSRCDKCREGCMKQAKEMKQLSFKDKNYLIRLAETPEEIITEGAILSHCVGGYLERHSEGKTHIFVVRKISEPDKPFYTLELNNNYGLVQIRGKHNCSETPEVKAFRMKWEKKLKAVNEKRQRIKVQAVA